MTRADLHRLIDELPEDRVEGTAQVLMLIKAHQLDPDQAWFWTPEWQEGEREVDESLARGARGPIFESDEHFIAHLSAPQS